jgi:hypothetical protein
MRVASTSVCLVMAMAMRAEWRSLSRPSHIPPHAALPFRFEPVEAIKNFLGKWTRRTTQPAKIAPLLVAAPHRFIFVEATDKFLRVSQRIHGIPISEKLVSF